MRTNELMLYDKVQLNYRYDHPILQIISIYGEAVLVRNENNCKQWKIGIQDIEPIPLTAEILEKNGWEKAIGENPVEVWSIGKGAYLHKTDNGYKLREGAEFNIPNIQYVHTLQQALRLCGLTDLANNFKID